MIHYSCDRCKKNICSDDNLRYVIRIEVRAAMDFAEFIDEEDDRDYLMEAHEALERAEDEINEVVSEDIYQNRRYDLCPSCYRKFIQNPVGNDRRVEFDFSEN